MNFLKKLFAKKGAEDDDDYDVDEDDEIENDPDVLDEVDDEDDSGGGGDDEESVDGDEDDEESSGRKFDLSKFAKYKKLALFGAAGVAGVALIGGLAAFFLVGSDDKPASGALVSLQIPGRGTDGGLTPPKEGAEDAPATEGEATPEAEKSLSDLAKEGETEGAGAGVVITSTSVTAFDDMIVPAAETPLTAAPILDVTEQGPDGPLPLTSASGLEPWRLYARDFEAPQDKPKVVVIVSDLGLSRTATMAAIENLPGTVTLAFSPYGSELADYAAKARERGHEILVILPLEPDDFPKNDPGPLALLSPLDEEVNNQKLDKILATVPGHVGVLAYMGSRFTAEETATSALMRHLKRRGIMWIDNRASANAKSLGIAQAMEVPFAVLDMRLDDEPGKSDIDARLAQALEAAQSSKVVVILATPLPSTLDRLSRWIATLDPTDPVLAPVTAVANLQAQP
ncbi:hypothetical protein JCM17960_03440 [Magnetospira thiophila]